MLPKETQILNAAREHFFRYGFKKANVEEIAHDAGVGKGTVYNYFDNKEALFIRCAEQDYQSIREQLKKVLKAEKNAEQKLIRLLLCKLGHIKGLILQYSMSRVVFEEMIDTHVKLSNKKQEAIHDIQQLLEEGETEGLFRKADHHKNAVMIEKIQFQFILRWLEMDSAEIEQEVRDLFELIFGGLRQ
ncbi:MAG: TetR/AcrR family transcriptional regulator [SAR324 cluster bacterium]|nr:TetR/AcrR family transcriptional regulator [SAR324 cluster bacterium]